jgi:Protein of unknown function (DUF2911)
MLQLTTIRLATALSLVLLSTAVWSQGVTTPRTPSPAATAAQTIGISTVTVNYSRPSVKGRAVWGGLVPYGWNVQAFGAHNSAPWRAGANENTVLRLSHPAMVEGQAVPAGSYGLFFVINKDGTGEVILSKDSRSWGSFFYNPSQDQMRAKITLRAVPHTELLTYDFMNLTKTSGELVLNWEKMQFPVKIEFAVDEIVMANADDELKGPVGFNWQGYSSAANYALTNKVNPEKALGWIDLSIAQNKSFTTLSIKSGLLTQMGKTDEGARMMDSAVVISTENELNTYSYQLMAQNQTDKAIELLALNAKRYPKDPNVWDSLGEAYATKGDKKNAIVNFKKSLSMNPPAGVKANSEKFLAQLGAN